jgi:hypothetical protein
MPPDGEGTTSPEVLENSQAARSPRESLRPLAVEPLIREARAAGYDGPQRKLVRLVRTYLKARGSGSFAEWLTYSDPTATTAIRNLEEPW